MSRTKNTAQRVYAQKYMANPLFTYQYASGYEHLEVLRDKDQTYPVLKECGFIPVSTLKHYHTINHLSNSTRKLEQELDTMLSKEIQVDEQIIFKEKLQQLMLFQFEKYQHSLAGLQELRLWRNSLATRCYIEQKQFDPDSMIYDPTKAADQQGPDNSSENPFSSKDLLQNVRIHAASGVFGNTPILPVAPEIIEQFMEPDLESGVQRQDFPSFTLLTTGKHMKCHDLAGYVQGCVQFCRIKDLPTKTTIDQTEVACHAFSEIALEIRDEMQKTQLFKLRGEKSHGSRAQQETLLKDLQQQLRVAATRCEQLLNRVTEAPHNDKQLKIGEIIQFGSFPLFKDHINDSNESSQITDTAFGHNQQELVIDDLDIIRETKDEPSQGFHSIDAMPVRQIGASKTKPSIYQQSAYHPPAIQSTASSRNSSSMPTYQTQSQVSGYPVPPSTTQQMIPLLQQSYTSNNPMNQNASTPLNAKQSLQMQQHQLNVQMQNQQIQQQFKQKQLSQSKSVVMPDDQSPVGDAYCICGKADEQGMMIQCENEDCKRVLEGWYHSSCLGLPDDQNQTDSILKEVSFYCPDCWVRMGNSFDEYGKDWNLSRAKVATVRNKCYSVWLEKFDVDLYHSK